MADWQALQALTDKIVGAAFAETVRHSPMKSGASDPTRPQQELRGILYAPSARGMINVAGSNIVIAAGEHALCINRADYPALSIRATDVIRAIGRPGTPGYQVKSVADRVAGVLVVTLGEA